MYEVGRVFPRHVQRTYLTGESPLSRPRVTHTLQLYNYLLRFYLTALGYIILAAAIARKGLDPKAFSGYIISILPLGIGISFLFRGIIEKLNRLSS